MNDELKALSLYRLNNPNELTPSQFQKLEIEIKQPQPNTISDEYADFKLWRSGYPSRQHLFKDLLSSQFRKKNISKILEVGCGRTAKLSKLLASEGYDVTCIDPKLEIPEDSANLKGIKDVFDYQTFDLSGFDFVVAQEPCEATEHIVRACINCNVPFIISLCGVPHTLISGETPDNVYEWYGYLLKISPNNIKIQPFSMFSFVTMLLSYSNL